jgi:hypothetical protein
MKQLSHLPIKGKKITTAEMKALRGGQASQGCVQIGWTCSLDCCYDDLWECQSNCQFGSCLMAICPV